MIVPRLLALTTVVIVAALSQSVSAAVIDGDIADAITGQPLAARLYVEDADGKSYFAESSGRAVRYDKQNWINARSVERHTTLSADRFRLELPPGRYLLTVERGKEYFAHRQMLDVTDAAQTLRIPLHRWINLAERGWYSGETHIHRPLEDLPTLVQAEDLNVAFPLSYWVTKGFAPPTQGDKNLGGEIPAELIRVDDTHVIWPRNTEYEIFTIDDKRHTLGAIFVLNHKSVFTEGVPPLGPMAAKARAEGALFDLDKHDWPWAMSLLSSAGVGLYELSNNHVWRTEFAFRQFNANASAYLFPPAGGKTGDERQWLHFTWNTYYSLLNCGFPLKPTAGTASGVHPVPVGFSRVYVHLPDGFSYQKWLDGLAAGRSFVTTGPMLFATVNDQQPGAKFSSDGEPVSLRIQGEMQTIERPLMVEVVVNGRVVQTVMSQSRSQETGVWSMPLRLDVPMNQSGWVIVRGFAETPAGRLQFAHTAPWFVEIAGKPLRPRREEVDYLVRRMDEELARSKGVLPAAAIAEYERARAEFAAIESDDVDLVEARRPQDDADLRRWLENMTTHQFTLDEMQAAIGQTPEELQTALRRFDIQPIRSTTDKLLVLPFPGGRHPRTGFLDGAVRPQRDTKISVFPPWEQGGYVVVDVPEAIFSNLGLTYLAHTHVPTIWSKQSVDLARREWRTEDDGRLVMDRTLPNDIAFGATVTPHKERVDMELWLKNSTTDKLTGMRVQVCSMLQAATGFGDQTAVNKLLRPPFAACSSSDKQRWIVTAWTPNQRAWANPPVPCLHSDPQFPDCEPGETVRVRGAMWFVEGTDIEAQLERLQKIVAAW